jgi:transcriptional regulator with XRE-family HTH domain
MSTRYRIWPGAVREFVRIRMRESDGSLRGDGLAKFADFIDVSPGQLSRVLNSKVPLSWEMLSRISSGLGVPIDAISEPIRNHDGHNDEPEREEVAS